MKKIFLFSLIALGITNAWAIQAPTSANGSGLPIEYVGYQYANIDAGTGTAAIIINSTGTNGRSIGPAVVYGVITSSISQADYLVFKDTTGVGNIAGYLATQSTLTTLNLSTAMVVQNWMQNQASTLTAQIPFPTLNLIKFPVPIRFNSGILVQASGAPPTNGGVSRWTILYRNIGVGDK